MQKQKVKIDPLGRPTIDAEGFGGQGCLAASKPIVDALSGGKAGAIVTAMKPEAQLLETEQSADNELLG